MTYYLALTFRPDSNKNKETQLANSKCPTTMTSLYGDIIHVYKSGTNELVSKIEIKRDQHYYKISDETEDPNEFGIKLHNQLDIDLDIVLSYDAAQQRKVWRDLYLDVTPNEEIIYHAYDGDILQVYVAKTDEEVAKLIINRDQYLVVLITCH